MYCTCIPTVVQYFISISIYSDAVLWYSRTDSQHSKVWFSDAEAVISASFCAVHWNHWSGKGEKFNSNLSLIHSVTHSFTHSPNPTPLPHSLTHTHALTHSLTQSHTFTCDHSVVSFRNTFSSYSWSHIHQDACPQLWNRFADSITVL